MDDEVYGDEWIEPYRPGTYQLRHGIRWFSIGFAVALLGLVVGGEPGSMIAAVGGIVAVIGVFWLLRGLYLRA